MAHVSKSEGDGVTVRLTAPEAGRLCNLLYVVESGNHPAPLFSLLMEAGVHPGPLTFDAVPAHSVEIVKDSDLSTAEYLTSLAVGLPEGAHISSLEGSSNVVVTVTIPR